MAQPEDRLLALMAGFQLHLAKPVDGRMLTQSLAALAGRMPEPAPPPAAASAA